VTDHKICDRARGLLIFNSMLTNRRVFAMTCRSALLAVLVALAVAVAPTLAHARAGGGSSFGSRGSYTYTTPPATRTAPYSAAPMQRSMTQAPSRDYGSGYAGSGYRSGFGSGLLGGLIGVGLGSLLFGHGGFGFFSLFGLIIRLAILFFVIRWLIRLFRGSAPAFAGGPNMFARAPQPDFGPRPVGGRAGAPPLAIGRDDYNAFEQTLYAVQDAWSRRDLARLQTLATPEMVGYFNEQLSEQASREVVNTVTDVRLLQGDLAQAWSEQGRDYTTVAMRFSMVDVTRDAAGRVVDGSPTEHVTATELWTFVRAPGGRWVLSAIQQAR
jgi:predicted lipid-binding transport protein (Tim44 family)